MSRLVALALAAAALAMPAAGPAGAEECVGGTAFGACYTRECRDHHCIVRDYTVTTHCNHPMPPALCRVSAVKATVPGVIL